MATRRTRRNELALALYSEVFARSFDPGDNESDWKRLKRQPLSTAWRAADAALRWFAAERRKERR